MRRPLHPAALWAASALGWLAASSLPALSQDKFPSRAIRIVSPFPAGAVSDISLRLLAERLAARLGTQIRHREPADRRRRCGSQGRALLASGRAHARAIVERHRGQRRPVQETALRSAGGFRAGRRHQRFLLCVSHQRQVGVAHSSGRDRSRTGQSGQAQFRHRRRGHEPQSHGAAVSQGRRHRFHGGAVPRRDRPDGRAHAQRRGRGDQCLWRGQGQPARWQLARHRHDGGGPARRRCPTCRPSANPGSPTSKYPPGTDCLRPPTRLPPP